MTSPATDQIVVTFREMERIFSGNEAVENLQEAARQDTSISSAQRAAIMAGIGNVLNALRRAERAAGANVLTAPDNAAAARLQSLVASGENAKLDLRHLSSGGLEAKFDTDDWFGWASVALEKLKNPTPHPLAHPKGTQAQSLPNRGRIALLGDWGTGLYGAPSIASSIARDPDDYALILHLGDIYYSGTVKETQARFLSLWPNRPEALSRALNSNHEMYSGGYAYFDQTLVRFNQDASYFVLENPYWIFVGLDTAHSDHHIDDRQVVWLEEVIARAGERRIVLFSHHQLYSHLEANGDKIMSHQRFRRILDSRRIFAWYWGHEHRCVLFDNPDPQFGILARCIGHGGMPQGRGQTRNLTRARDKIFEGADWRTLPERTKGGLTLPACTLLDGPNPFITGEEDRFSPHGYAVLTFDSSKLIEDICDPLGNVIYRNQMAM